MHPAIEFILQSDWVVQTFALVSVVMLTLILDRLYELGRTALELRGMRANPHRTLRRHSALHLLTAARGADERETDWRLSLFEQRLRRYLTLLGLIAVLSPMLGLVGTFLGVFEVFEGVSSVGLSDPKVIAGGIRKVLVDTVAGLGIAIPAMAAYKGLEAWAFSLSLRGEALLYETSDDAAA